MTGSSAEVIRKEADGLWRFIFDDSDVRQPAFDNLISSVGAFE